MSTLSQTPVRKPILSIKEGKASGVTFKIEFLNNLPPFKTVRPFVLGISLFLVLNLVITLATTCIPSVHDKLHAKVDNILPQKLGMIEAEKSVDILALGTSQTHNGFMPDAFEKTSGQKNMSAFNMGLPGTRYDVMKTYLALHIQKHGKPKRILLEMNDALVEDKAVYFYLPAQHYRVILEKDPQQISSVLLNPAMAPETKKELLLGGMSSLYQFRSLTSPVSVQKKVTSVVKEKTGLKKSDLAEILPDTPKQDISPAISKGWFAKGTSPMMATSKGIAENAQAAQTYYLAPIQKPDFQKLEALLQYCNEQDIPVTLVQWPNHPQYQKRFNTSKIHQPYTQGVETITKKYGVTYINLNTALPKNTDGLFADTRHLTPKGAALFSARLATESK